MKTKSTAFALSMLIGACLVVLGACKGTVHPTLEDLTGHESLSLFKIGSVRGTRDGDRLETQAMLTDSSSILILNLRFTIGSPMTLASGSWRWSRTGNTTEGTVTARSISFLGGQDGPPSIGGRFDLLGPDGLAHFRVNIPITELKTRL